MSDIDVYAGVFAVSVGAFCLALVTGSRIGLASDLIAITGSATCGWSWLLARALFEARRARPKYWPLATVLLLVSTGIFLRLFGTGTSAWPRVVDNLGGLVSSSLLMLAAVEPLKGLVRGLPGRERRFRMGFALTYCATVAVAVIWVDGAPADDWVGQWSQPIKAACAVLAVLGFGFAVWYRHRHPLPEAGLARPRLQTDEVRVLGDRVLGLMKDEAIFTRPDLKVAHLARYLGEADYKVTQSITGPLAFRNFNHMANHFRIEEARHRLVDPRFDLLPVLTIAFDCGFGSIGPFNRAFKAQTGMTPNQYRKAGGGLDRGRSGAGHDLPDPGPAF